MEGLLSVGADVTERRESEAALRGTTAELERAVAELEDLRNGLEEENVYLREEIRTEHGFENIVGASDPLLYVLHKVRRVAPTDTSVLILGETGIGKELVARAIHDEQPAREAALRASSTARALPASLSRASCSATSAGAFTGADRQRRGRFELADGGTLFLDEIGELPLEHADQAAARAAGGRVRAGRRHRDASRSTCASSPPPTETSARTWRRAGSARTSTTALTVYPDHRAAAARASEDIPLLVQHFVRHFAERRGSEIAEIPAEVMRAAEAYDWPGNVRELQNVIERAVLTSTGGVLKLAEPLQNAAIDRAADAAKDFGEGLLPLDEVERRYIERVLASTRGKISGSGGAAEVLGLHANTLRYRMKKLGISAGRRNPKAPSDR